MIIVALNIVIIIIVTLSQTYLRSVHCCSYVFRRFREQFHDTSLNNDMGRTLLNVCFGHANSFMAEDNDLACVIFNKGIQLVCGLSCNG